MNSDLQNKMLNYEVPPPEGTWEKLASFLDEQKVSFPSRLYEYEEGPPAGAWNFISRRLNGAVRENQVSFFTRYRRPLKYTGAMAALFVLVVLGSLLISKKTESEVPSSGLSAQPAQNHTTANTPAREEKNDQQEKYTPASIKDAVAAAVRKSFPPKAAALEASDPPAYAAVEQFIPVVAERNAGIPYNLAADQYMIYSDAEGNVMRLPKRLYDAVACPNDEANCRQKLRSLQEKIASSIRASDLAGMLEMLNNLPENQ